MGKEQLKQSECNPCQHPTLWQQIDKSLELKGWLFLDTTFFFRHPDGKYKTKWTYEIPGLKQRISIIKYKNEDPLTVLAFRIDEASVRYWGVINDLNEFDRIMRVLNFNRIPLEP